MAYEPVDDTEDAAYIKVLCAARFARCWCSRCRAYQVWCCRRAAHRRGPAADDEPTQWVPERPRAVLPSEPEHLAATHLDHTARRESEQRAGEWLSSSMERASVCGSCRCCAADGVQGRIGGDTSLAPRGQLYAQKLAEFMNRVGYLVLSPSLRSPLFTITHVTLPRVTHVSRTYCRLRCVCAASRSSQHYPPGTDLTVWTSCLKRTAQTAAHIHRDIVQWRGLDEIDAGAWRCSGPLSGTESRPRCQRFRNGTCVGVCVRRHLRRHDVRGDRGEDAARVQGSRTGEVLLPLPARRVVPGHCASVRSVVVTCLWVSRSVICSLSLSLSLSLLVLALFSFSLSLSFTFSHAPLSRCNSRECVCRCPRLEPVIIELMRQQGPVLIVSHQATLRVLYAYLTFRRPSECPSLPMPLHTVIQLTPRAYGCEEVRHELHV
jgi:broad specificity phosphatase PhoE